MVFREFEREPKSSWGEGRRGDLRFLIRKVSANFGASALKLTECFSRFDRQNRYGVSEVSTSERLHPHVLFH